MTKLLAAPAVLLVLGLLAVPLALLVRVSLYEPARGRGFYAPGTVTLANYADILDSHGLRLIGFTLAFGTAVAGITLALAYPLALAIRTLSARGRSLAVAAVLLPKFGGSLAVLFGLSQVLSASGIVGRWFDVPLTRNLCGAVVGEVYLVLPYAVLLLAVQLNRIDPQLEAAARGLGATRRRAFRRVTLPLSLPGLVLTGELCLAWGLAAFLGPQFLGGPAETTLAVEVHRQAFEYGRWPRAAALAVVLLALVAGVFALVRGMTRALPRPTPTVPVNISLERVSRIGRFATVVGVAILLVPPAVAAWVSFSPDAFLTPPTGEWSLRWYAAFAEDARWTAAVARSAAVAAGAAAVAVLAGFPAGYAVERCRFRGKAFVNVLAVLPAGVPPVALGMGLLPLAFAAGVWGSPLPLVLVHGLLGLPAAYLAARSHFAQTPVELEAAARGLGATPAKVAWRITLPLARPAAVAAAAAAGVGSWNEAVACVFLCTPSSETLPAVTWPQLRYAASPLVAVAAVAGMTLAAAAAVLGVSLKTRERSEPPVPIPLSPWGRG